MRDRTFYKKYIEPIWIFLRTIPYWKWSHKNGYYLFFDDGRIPMDVTWEADSDYLETKWIVVRNYNQFVKCIDTNFKNGRLCKKISLDHDLADLHIKWYFENGGHANPPNPINMVFEEKTGMDCAKWLVEYCIDNNMKLPAFKVHSKNTCGNANIYSLLTNYAKHSNQ